MEHVFNNPSSGHWIRRSAAVQVGASGTQNSFESPDHQNIMFRGCAWVSEYQGWPADACQCLTLSRLSSVSARFDLIWCWDNNIVLGECTDCGGEKDTDNSSVCVCACSRVQSFNS